MASELVVDVDGSNFESVVMNSEIPVVVDFWAPWCGPCKQISPVLDEFAKEFNGRVLVAKVNVDNNASLAAAHGIQSIPTLLVVNGGKVTKREVGFKGKDHLRKLFETA